MGSASVFEEHRFLLFTIAYEITGTVTDAEDVLQESYLKWSAVDTAAIGNPPAYLAKTVTRQALDSLRTTQRRREDYIRPLLPEPVVTLPMWPRTSSWLIRCPLPCSWCSSLGVR
jgi:RNA polymerase sigma-70 factor, ECF subfamily